MIAADDSPVDRAAPSGDRRTLVFRVLRLVVSLSALAYLALTLDVRAVLSTLTRLPLPNLLAALASVVFALFVGAFRHRVLLGAYGATERPSLLTCLHLYWVGFFYNTFLPGSVGGDVLRAVGARTAFGAHGTTASIAVVLVERVLGLFGLVLVAGVAFAIQPLEGVEGLWIWVVLGLAAACVGVGFVALGRRLAPRVPGFVGRQLGRFPELVNRRDFFLGFVASIVSHLTVAATGHFLIVGLDAHVRWITSAVVVPVGAAAAYFPLTVSGLGVREAAFARLYETAHVAPEAAAAFALAFLGAQLSVALVGGAISWFDTHKS